MKAFSESESPLFFRASEQEGFLEGLFDLTKNIEARKKVHNKIS
jgi:hypothetical protein